MVASSTKRHRKCYEWMLRAMGNVATDEELQKPGIFSRVDLKIATDIMKKVAEIRKKQSVTH